MRTPLRPCVSCTGSVPTAAAFCPMCGVPQPMTLDGLCAVRHLHCGHDYRREERDASGSLTALYELGVSPEEAEQITRLLPGYTVTERRRNTVSGPMAWVRIDIVRR